MKQSGQVLLFVLLLAVAIGFIGVLLYISRLTPGTAQYEPNAPSLSPSPSGSPTIADVIVNWKVYKDQKYGFSFKYPQNYSQTDVESFYIPPYYLEQNIVSFSTTDSIYQVPLHYTQYSIFNISKSADIANCLMNPKDNSALTKSLVINGTTFNYGSSGGVGAGNQISSVIYRSVKGENCFEIALSIETSGDGNGIDMNQVSQSQNMAKQELDQIFSTFKFATSTPGPIVNDCRKMCPYGKAVECSAECLK